MSDIDFDLWIEDFSGHVDRYNRYNDYEEAQYRGLCVMNEFREVKNWHITVAGQRPDIKSKPIPSSLERYHEFHERIPV